MLRAFTIIELLVSIGIFAISSALMFGALFGATEVFRRGEAARQAGDEATAVIAALQEDLSRAVPIRLRDGEPAKEWGRLWTSSEAPTGNGFLGLVIENPDRSQVRWIVPAAAPATRLLVGVRKWVVWHIISSPSPNATAADSLLVREEWDMTEDGNIVDKNGANLTSMPSSSTQIPLKEEIVTRGVLHFGVWLELADAHRLMTAGVDGPQFGWESRSAPMLPEANTSFDTRTQQGGPPTSLPRFYPQPEAVRISLVLTGGGRFATRGTLVTDISDTDTTARISGIKALPTIYGSLLRIDNEWVRYENFRNGLVTISANGRGALRSTTTTHTGRPTVFAGQPFSLVVAVPR